MKEFVEPAHMATLIGGEIAAREWRLIAAVIVVAGVVLWLLLKTKFLEHITPILAALPATWALPIS